MLSKKTTKGKAFHCETYDPNYYKGEFTISIFVENSKGTTVEHKIAMDVSNASMIIREIFVNIQGAKNYFQKHEKSIAEFIKNQTN